MSPILDFIIWLLHILDPFYISHLVMRVRIPLASSFSQRPPDQNTFLSSRSCHIRCMCCSGISTVASARAMSQPSFICLRTSLLRIPAASNNCSIFRANGIGYFRLSPLAFVLKSCGFVKHSLRMNSLSSRMYDLLTTVDSFCMRLSHLGVFGFSS